MDSDKFHQPKNDKPDFNKIRAGLFWDTDIQKIDWLRQSRAVIERILERGNDREIEEIKRFYGNAEFERIVEILTNRSSPGI